MNKHTAFPLLLSLTLAALGLAALLATLPPAHPPVLAAPATTTDETPSLPTRPLLATGAPELITVCLSGCPYNSIQTAVNAVAEGGLVKVAAGTYTGSSDPLLTISKTVTVRGGYTTADWTTADPDAHPTILDGNNLRQIIRITAGDPTVEGFHIRNGQATNGGGLYITGGAATVRRCRLFDNDATANGGGLYIAGGAPTLENLLIYSNSAQRGGGLYIADGAATLRYTTLHANQATQQGGGLYIATGAPAITGTIIANSTGSGIYNSGGSPLLGHNDLWNNSGGNYSGLSAGATDIQADPRFADAANDDLHLLADSPCIDAGASTYPTDDYDGRARPLGDVPDIGAYEFYTGTCFARIAGSNVYTSVQTAMDTATDGDLVQIAGLCSGVTVRHGSTQTVYISRSITLRGGYTVTNWSDPDPDAHPAILDAQGRGRVLYIAASSVEIADLHIRHGKTENNGAGIYAPLSNDTTIIGNRIYSNTTSLGAGGGLYLYGNNVLIRDNELYSNTSTGNGGGMDINGSDNLVADNTVHDNQCSGTGCRGGGVYLNGRITAQDNEIYSNSATHGGGIAGEGNTTDALITGNDVHHNTATYGGGCHWSEGTALLENNTFHDNQATQTGGGIYPYGTYVTIRHNTIVSNRVTGASGGGIGSETFGDRHITITNNLIGYNTANDKGGGVHLTVGNGAAVRVRNNLILTNTATYGGGAHLYVGSGDLSLHIENNTIYDNQATDANGGGGIYLYQEQAGHLNISNTIIVNNIN